MPASRQRGVKRAKLKSHRRAAPDKNVLRDQKDFTVVGIGASAGGLDACRKLLSALPAGNGMAFILVQHLDPNHESMLVNLLARQTTMTVCQAVDGMPIEREHLYIIPPGTYLSVEGRILHLTAPQVRHGARLPFDFLLHSLAQACGPRAICVILSGTGMDGNLGLKAIKENGGLVIAQDPLDAGYDGMPKSAIATGAVDLVLAAAKIPDVLVRYSHETPTPDVSYDPPLRDPSRDLLPEIVELLRQETSHDFSLYKPGTLQRRIERRMAMASLDNKDLAPYLAMLRGDRTEIDLLAKDLLINVTSFFRDPKVFDFLAEKIVPGLIHNRLAENALRIWTAGCSTGEETYSLAMLFRERIEAEKCDIKLQIFASDIDPDAVAEARDGFYPETIAANVSPDRLTRFFVKEKNGYRVSPKLRATVVFTVQDLLVDPPFSRLDLISCRNLLIYLRPEAQNQVLSLFHFALREGGLLLLGPSETVGNADSRFATISEPERLYRHIGRSRPGEFGLLMGKGEGSRPSARPGQSLLPSRQSVLAELCRQLVMESYAPAAVLINRKGECLYSLGPTDRYLRVVPGYPTHDLLAIVHQDLRIKLRSAIQQANTENKQIVVSGDRTDHDGKKISFGIDIRPVSSEGEDLLLVCFVDKPEAKGQREIPVPAKDVFRVTELEQELVTTKTELQGAIHNLEISGEEQRAINEEALSVNEEYQSTNEELLASKEELQSLNEELTALNNQLQETLTLQRRTYNDLQNVMNSTDVATVFLDADLCIRFFTPATKLLFKVIPGDIGRPLADLSSLAADSELLADAKVVLASLTPIEREIKAQSGAWYIRRIQPYRTSDNSVEGVVITFIDNTERRRTADTLEVAKQQADQANIAKSHFLAAASHDLRQPLQTLTLLQGQLAKTVEGPKAKNLVARLDETLGAISGMLNALLDINQIEAGAVHSEVVGFQVNDLFTHLQDEFCYHAQAHGIALHIVPCSLIVYSDPRLLEQMIRNLLSNALKFTSSGKVLLGCRRHGGCLSIEVWDTGIGIPAAEHRAIFEEYHQIDNPARERSRGLGLGLSIVQRLGDLLGHKISVRSQPGKGSCFAVEIILPPKPVAWSGPYSGEKLNTSIKGVYRTGKIMVVEDDPEVRSLLESILKDEGHRIAAALDGIAAFEMVARGTANPDLILADYNLPGGMNGLQTAAKIQKKLRRSIPVVILTGDISTATMREIEGLGCVQLNKPVRLKELMAVIQRLLSVRPSKDAGQETHPVEDIANTTVPVIFVVDDDSHIRDAVRGMLEEEKFAVEDFASSEDFLAAYRPGRESCLLVDSYLPGMNGLELLQRLRDDGQNLPAIMITGYGDVPMAVGAMKAGALDFLEKPIGRDDLLASIERALEQSKDAGKRAAWREKAEKRIAGLTARQRQILDLILAGNPNKNIAADLGISQRTVENHRAAIMRKTGSKSLPALARLVLVATQAGADASPASGTSIMPTDGK
jgi:two-component system CheB/CheR fusion protein